MNTTLYTRDGIIVIEVLRDMEEYYVRLRTTDNSDERVSCYNKIASYMENFIWAKRYYGLMPKKHFYKDRVVKLKDYDVVQLTKTSVTDVPIENDIYNSEWDTREMHYPYELSKVTGLYFLGMVNTNPITNETFYWVKIGYASDLLSRMRVYNTHCPMIWNIDYSDSVEEKYYHQRLAQVALAKCNHNDEWFMVDRTTYLAMCDKGFRYFK